MAGNANSGTRRYALPKGKEAEEELKRLKRNQRRKERREQRALEAMADMSEATEDAIAGDEQITRRSSIPKDRAPTVDELKADLMGAYHELGGQASMVAWGRRYPKEFYALWARYCLPPAEESGGNEDQGGLEAMLAQLDAQAPTVN